MSGKRYFVGFSTVDAQITGLKPLYDQDLIIQDLKNALNTLPGTRVMRSGYGCKIWYYFMENLTPLLEDQIVKEVTRVVELDARVSVSDVVVTEAEQGVTVSITAIAQPWNVALTFTQDFNTRQLSAIQGSSN